MFLCINTLWILKHTLQCGLFPLHAVNSLAKHVVAYNTLWPDSAARGTATSHSDVWFSHTVYTDKWNTASRSQGNPRSIVWINRVPSTQRVEYNCDLHGLQTRKRKPKSGTPKSESSGGGGCGGGNSSSVQQTPSIVKVEQPGTVETLRRISGWNMPLDMLAVM